MIVLFYILLIISYVISFAVFIVDLDCDIEINKKRVLFYLLPFGILIYWFYKLPWK